jgi:hypothetical protein
MQRDREYGGASSAISDAGAITYEETDAMDIRIHIDSTSPEATAARRQMLSLIAAYTGGEGAYLPMLGELANALVTTSDPLVIARRVAYFMDSAALISFALANALAQLEERDVGHVLKLVEDAVEKRLAEGGTP